MKEISVSNECYYCLHKQSVPGNTHIACENPDTNMKGDSYGIEMGWFIYPILFDPAWKTKKCSNYENNK